MSLVTNPEEARWIYQTAARRGVCLPNFCAENIQTLEAILQAAKEFSEEHKVKGLPVIIAFTANYHERQQLKLYTGLNNIDEGFLAIRSDIVRLTRAGGPYEKLKVMVHLDHSHPVKDKEIIRKGQGFFSSVMYDCSYLPIEENMKRTADFVRKYKKVFVIEGVVDEIIESGKDKIKDKLTEPEEAGRYVEKTGVDLIVCNLGTEHRATLADKKYNCERARQISGKVGKILVIHGTSSLKDSELVSFADDGIVKVNIWTKLEKTGGQAVANEIVKHSCEILSARPALSMLTESHRRYEVWIPAVVNLIKNYLNIFGAKKYNACCAERRKEFNTRSKAGKDKDRGSYERSSKLS
ncbi:MAG: class II fructose-bisphosphate aldolase [Candidatus Firestonebacteria bacterium]